jgi:hypothetical protein
MLKTRRGDGAAPTAQNETAPGGESRGGFAGEKPKAYQPPNGISVLPIFTIRLPRASSV